MLECRVHTEQKAAPNIAELDAKLRTALGVALDSMIEAMRDPDPGSRRARMTAWKVVAALGTVMVKGHGERAATVIEGMGITPEELAASVGDLAASQFDGSEREAFRGAVLRRLGGE